MRPETPLRDLTALPVALALGERHVGSVRRWLEGTVGWQAVEDDPDGPVPPAVRLIDVEAATTRDIPDEGGPGLGGRLPTLLLIEDDDRPLLAARATERVRPAAVCRWPQERTSLPDLVERVLRVRRADPSLTRSLRVGGASGGVGTTTVTLALAGLSAWSGTSTLAVTNGPTGLRRATTVPADALGASDLWARAAPVPGVPGLRAVHTGRTVADRAPQDHRVGLTLLDVGTSTELDILVCRPDGAAATQVPATMAGAVVVVGDGLLSDDRLQRLAGGRRVIRLPVSARVARAVLRREVPAGLPESWLRPLRPLVDRLEGSG